MGKTPQGITTPGGRPYTKENPHSSEFGPKDSGVGRQLPVVDNMIIDQIETENKELPEINPFQRQGIFRSLVRIRSSSLSNNKTKTQDVNVMQTEKYLSEPRSDVVEKVKNLEEQLKAAQNEIKELKQLLRDQLSKNNYSSVDSSEEEDLVAKETAWIMQKNRKRRIQHSPEEKQSKSIPKVIEGPKITEKPEGSKNKKPPPVVLGNVENYTEINKTLQANKLNFRANLMNNNQLKINVDNELEYRNLTGYLNNTKIEWHTYENKQTRPIRVMVRNLHPSCNPEDIKDELLSNNFMIIDVVNKTKKIKDKGITKQIPLPLFLLSFANTEDIKKIYEIKYLCHMAVKIEAVRSNKLMPQCKRCQRYEHTQKFCKREPICVRCAGNHLTINCQMPKDKTPKCSNCAEAHPASYRGCLVAKELQKRRNNRNKPAITQTNRERTFSSSKVVKEITYADLVKERTIEQPKQNSNDVLSMKQMMQSIIDKMNEFSTRLERMEMVNSRAIAHNSKK